jgi:molybdopterin-guanine dinucleotide biosynthesis protein A
MSGTLRPPSRRIAAVILAGGRARRMEGADKGLAPLRGRPLIAWVLERVAPQVDEVFISANRNLEAYRRFGRPVLKDDTPDFQGPLAGIHRAMRETAAPLILSVPCDTPFLPTDLVARLAQALDLSGAEIAIPRTEDQPQRAVSLCRRELAKDLGKFLEQGRRRVGEWQQSRKTVVVPFEDGGAFRNINTPEELAAAERAQEKP